VLQPATHLPNGAYRPAVYEGDEGEATSEFKNVLSLAKQPHPGEHCPDGIEIVHTSLSNQGEACVIEVRCLRCQATRQFDPTTSLWGSWQATRVVDRGRTAAYVEEYDGENDDEGHPEPPADLP
jgi:hypothetical protein